MSDRPDYSILVTTFNEEATIEQFHRRLSDTIRTTPGTFEIVYVNDGSRDATFDRLERLFESDDVVGCVADLYRNFGQAAALSAAVQQARGTNLILLDSDLQIEPEELPLMLERFDANTDAVIGYRKRRHDSFGRRFFSKLANVVMRRAGKTQLRDLGCGFKIFRGDIIRAFSLGDLRVFNTMEFLARCSRHAEVGLTHHPRAHGRSGWTFPGLVQVLFASLVNTSDRPFQYVALGMSLLGAAVVARVLLASFFAGSIMTVTNGLLLNAIVLDVFLTTGMLCVIGELLIRSLRILQRHPVFIIRTIRRRVPLAA